MVAPSTASHDVRMPGVAGDLLDQVQEDPAHRPGVDVVGVPRHTLRHRHVLAQVVDAPHDGGGLGGHLVVAGQQAGQRPVAEPEVLS
jgi:hypothetical protein